MGQLSVDKEVSINASQEKVFDFLTNPNKIPLVMSSLLANTNVPTLPIKKGTKFNYKYRLLGIIFTGTWTVTALQRPKVYKARTEGGVSSEWSYSISKKGKGTNVHLGISYALPKSILANIKTAAANSINKKETELFLHNLKTVIEMK